jgi:hypothetical protein
MPVRLATMRTARRSAMGPFAADQPKHRDRPDPMRQIDLLLLEDAMRRGIVTSDATARSFQLAALLLVLACVLFVLVHEMTSGNTSISAPLPKQVAGPTTSVLYPGLSGSEAYRAEKCTGDYVCDEDGAWGTNAVARTQSLTQLGKTGQNR